MNPFLNLVIAICEISATLALFLAFGTREPFLRVVLGTFFVLSTYVASVVVLFRVLSSGI